MNNSNSLQENENHIVQLVNAIFAEAIENNASDLHFESYEKIFRIRMRIDGILITQRTPHHSLAERICTRLKILANLNIAEKRLPQDGRFSHRDQNLGFVNIRLSTCPTIYGEKIVARILRASHDQIQMQQLGFEAWQKKLFEDSLQKPQGLILVTGPTGSGKTLTLYNALKYLNDNEKNISSIEDPVEIRLHGVNQINVNHKIGFTFATALKTFLRQDPDIIMVGEMRDLETTETAIRAAHTGHLVLSTLHTNSAIETLTRLRNMKVANYNLASSINLIIAQRLLRQLCPQCKVQDSLSLQNAEIIKLFQTYYPEVLNNRGENLYSHNPQGCNACQQGYKGRTAIYEMFPVSSDIKKAILIGASEFELLDLLKTKNFQSLQTSGLKKIVSGVSSFQEFTRVLGTISKTRNPHVKNTIQPQ